MKKTTSEFVNIGQSLIILISIDIIKTQFFNIYITTKSENGETVSISTK